MRHPNILCRENAVLVVVDVQERFSSHIYDFAKLVANIQVLIKAAGLLSVPVVLTEQYPRGLGKTVSEILDSLSELESYKYYEKSCFSSLGSEEFAQWLSGCGRKQVILAGIETHVCISQTAHDLLYNGYGVHLVLDAVSSRTASNKEIGIKKIVTAGGVPTSVETLVFEMLEQSGTELFKSVQKLVK